MERPSTTPRTTLRFRFVARVAIILLRLVRWRVRTRGLEHVPKHGGAVVTWNHHSYVDEILVVWDIYRVLGRSGRYLAKSELWESWSTRWAVELAEAVKVERGSGEGRARSLSAAVEALREGHLVMVAPEGTISQSFELLPFRAGAVRMAQAAGVPIIPSVSWGSHRLVTKGKGFKLRRGYGIPIEISYGAPIHVGPDDDPYAVTARLRADMTALLDEIQRDYPGGTPVGAWWVPARLGGGAPPPTDDPHRGSTHPLPDEPPSGAAQQRSGDEAPVDRSSEQSPP